VILNYRDERGKVCVAYGLVDHLVLHQPFLGVDAEFLIRGVWYETLPRTLAGLPLVRKCAATHLLSRHPYGRAAAVQAVNVLFASTTASDVFVVITWRS
jgi:hypothetical protein